MESKDLEQRFKWHTPRSAEVGQLHGDIRTGCHMLADIIDKKVPEGREKSLAITKLEEAMMWANAGIARGNAAE